jgi:hypothetical protein
MKKGWIAWVRDSEDEKVEPLKLEQKKWGERKEKRRMNEFVRLIVSFIQ